MKLHVTVKIHWIKHTIYIMVNASHVNKNSGLIRDFPNGFEWTELDNGHIKCLRPFGLFWAHTFAWIIVE